MPGHGAYLAWCCEIKTQKRSVNNCPISSVVGCGPERRVAHRPAPATDPYSRCGDIGVFFKLVSAGFSFTKAAEIMSVCVRVRQRETERRA